MEATGEGCRGKQASLDLKKHSAHVMQIKEPSDWWELGYQFKIPELREATLDVPLPGGWEGCQLILRHPFQLWLSCAVSAAGSL